MHTHEAHQLRLTADTTGETCNRVSSGTISDRLRLGLAGDVLSGNQADTG
jgi:hypothetical protein